MCYNILFSLVTGAKLGKNKNWEIKTPVLRNLMNQSLRITSIKEISEFCNKITGKMEYIFFSLICFTGCFGFNFVFFCLDLTWILLVIGN